MVAVQIFATDMVSGYEMCPAACVHHKTLSGLESLCCCTAPDIHQGLQAPCFLAMSSTSPSASVQQLLWFERLRLRDDSSITLRQIAQVLCCAVG